jgi:hypothetical protein
MTKTLKLVLAFSLFIKEINSDDEIKGSNPSPGAYFKDISEYYVIPQKQNSA